VRRLQWFPVGPLHLLSFNRPREIVLKRRESCTRYRLERSVSTQDPAINIVSLPPVALGFMHTPSTVEAELWTGASRAICRGFATKRV
jgi:hypothetical protein